MASGASVVYRGFVDLIRQVGACKVGSGLDQMDSGWLTSRSLDFLRLILLVTTSA